MEEVDLRGRSTPIRRQNFLSFWTSPWSFASLVALIFLIIISLQAVYDTRRQEIDLAMHDCGSTPAEAKAKGCVFDRLNYGWTPRACFDTELEGGVYKESMKKGPAWKWWLDGNTTQEIPQDWEELGKRTHVWTEHRYHVVHCVYTWKVLHRAAMKNSFVYAFIGNYGHTTHCSAMLEDVATNPKGAPAHMEVKMVFAGCMGLVTR